MANLEVVINQSNADLSYKDSDAVVELTKFKWLNKTKKLVSLNGITNVAVEEQPSAKVLPLNIDFQLRGVASSEHNGDGITAEFFGSILVAIKKGELEWDSSSPAFYTFSGLEPLLTKNYQEIYMAQRVSQLTLSEAKSVLTLGQDEDVLVLFTPISSLAQFQNAKLSFVFEDLTDVLSIDKINIRLPKYSLLQTITAKGSNGNKKSDFDFKIKPSGKYVLGYNQFTPEQVNEKIIFYSAWIDRTFMLPFNIAKDFLTSTGKSLKSIFDMNDLEQAKIYKNIITALILTKEYLSGFPSFSRDDNNKLDPKAEINGIFLTGLELKDSGETITNALFAINRDFSNESNSAPAILAKNIIDMLSVVINSSFSVDGGNNKSNEFLDPFYLFPRSEVSVAFDANTQKVSEATLLQDYKVSLSSKYYVFSPSVSAISSLNEKFKDISILPMVKSDYAYGTPVMPDTLVALDISTNPSERVASDGVSSSYRMLFPMDTHSDIESLFNISETEKVSVGRSSLQTKTFLWKETTPLRDSSHRPLLAYPTWFLNAWKYEKPTFKPITFPPNIPKTVLFQNGITPVLPAQSNPPEPISMRNYDGDINNDNFIFLMNWAVIGNYETTYGFPSSFFRPDIDTKQLFNLIKDDIPAGRKLFVDANGKEDISFIATGHIKSESTSAVSYLDLTFEVQYTTIPTDPSAPAAKHPKDSFLDGRLDKITWNNFINQHMSSDFVFDLELSETNGQSQMTTLSELVIRGVWIDDIFIKIFYTKIDGSTGVFDFNDFSTDAANDESIAVIKLLLNIGANL